MQKNKTKNKQKTGNTKEPSKLIYQLLSLWKKGRHFADHLLSEIALMKNFVFWFKFHWSFFPKGLVDNKAPLVQVLAWCRTGDKPLPEPIHRRLYAALGGDELTLTPGPLFTKR